MLFRDKSKSDLSAYFHRFAHLNDKQAHHFAESVWTNINEKNLIQHILPLQSHAHLILIKDCQHAVKTVCLKKCLYRKMPLKT